MPGRKGLMSRIPIAGWLLVVATVVAGLWAVAWTSQGDALAAGQAPATSRATAPVAGTPTVDVYQLAANALDEHMDSLQGACFAQGGAVSLGDKNVFKAALDKTVLRLEDGTDEAVRVMGGRDAVASTWHVPGRPDEMCFPFEIATRRDEAVPDTKQYNGIEWVKTPVGPAHLTPMQKQTLWHEMTHHIESMHGEYEKEVHQKYLAYRERNQAYIDASFETLLDLASLEKHMQAPFESESPQDWETWKADTGRAAFEKAVARFESFEHGVATRERIDPSKFRPGEEPTVWPPDFDELENWMGIKLRFSEILKRYASGACGEELKAFALKHPRNPSVLTAPEKRELFTCVCRCGSSIVGAGYHPEPGGDSPSCANLANGPCMGGQNGCYRWNMPLSGPCVAPCFAANNVLFDARAASLIRSENDLSRPTPGGGTSTTGGGTASQGLVDSGVSKYEQKRYADALSDFSQALAVDPRSPEAYRRRAMAKRELDDYAGAVSDFSKAIELAPQNSQAFAGRGQARERSGDLGGAKSDYSIAIELNPRYENALHYRTLVELRQKDFVAAKADCERLIALNPNSAPAHANRGMAEEQVGDLRSALADYERATALSPSDAFARAGAARVQARLSGQPAGVPTAPRGTSSWGTVYQPNSHGDAFEGGAWCNARNGSDWLQRTFDGVYEIREIAVGKAGSDVSTDGVRIVLKLQRPDGTWVVIDELRDTNIGWTELSGGARGRSLPAYSKALTPPVAARAVRIELSGHGWFNVSDVRVTGTPVSR